MMTIRRLHVLATVGILVSCISCADAPSSGLSGIVYGSPDTATQPEPVSGASAAVSIRLGCGDACEFNEARCEEGILLSCVSGTLVCEQCSSTGRRCGGADGTAVCIRECEGTSLPGTNNVRLCCPNTRWCEGPNQTFCNDSGTDIVQTACAKGLDCVEGSCVPAQPLVHVIFDTSESMNWTPFTDSKPAEVFRYPECDDPLLPQSRLGIAKNAFASLFSDAAYDNVLFALQRFPQRLNPYVGIFCPSAQYQARSLMTGHVGIQTTGGDWFSTHYREVLLERFPSDLKPNRLVLERWLDFDEVKVATEKTCVSDADCGAGFCVSSSCYEFENPEVRAPAAATPLGYSLFYAGEYFREFVVLEGAECALDADCDSPHHYCTEGTCRDRNRHCRQRSVVLFTDGVDTVAVGDFYQPAIQAKRLRAGLNCDTTAECGRAYMCTNGTCQPEGGNPCELLMMSCPQYTTSQVALGAEGNRLLDREGQAIELTVHVIDAAGYMSASAPVAGYGRGLLVQAPLDNSAALLEAIRPVFDWKDADFCTQ